MAACVIFLTWSNDVQIWETFNTIIGVVTHIYPDIFGQGVLHATAVNSKFIIPVL